MEEKNIAHKNLISETIHSKIVNWILIENNYLLIPLILIYLIGCDRSSLDKDSTKINLQLPTSEKIYESVKSFSQTLPIGKQICFAVNVTGPNIPNLISSSGNCHGSFGSFAGFKEEGSNLSIDVLKGSDRNFELYMYLADAGTLCPSLNENFFTSNLNHAKTYLVGKTSGVNINQDSQNVTINLQFQGLNNSLLANSGNTSCGSNSDINAKLRGMLFSDGSVEKVDDSLAGGTSTLLSNPIINSIFISALNFFDLSNLQIFTSSTTLGQGVTTNSLLDLDLSTSNIPEYLSSLSRDPITGKLFALDNSGLIYEVDSSTGEPISLQNNCPFPSCELPLWVQSISVGLSGSLFILDHTGQVYKVESSDLILLTDVVSPAVQQIVYY